MKTPRPTRRVSPASYKDSEGDSAGGKDRSTSSRRQRLPALLPTHEPSSASEEPEEDSSEIPDVSPRKSKQQSENGSSKGQRRKHHPPSKVTFPRIGVVAIVDTTQSERSSGTVVVSGRILGPATTD